MPRYTYLAKLNPQNTIQGEIEAETEQEAINKLTGMGYFTISVSLKTAALEKQGMFSLRKISKKDIVVFTRQLSTLIDSGINITNSLNMVAKQSNNKYLKVILNDLNAKIKDGNSLSQSLESYPKLFSSLYSSTIRTGEASGNLNETLKRLTAFLEKGEEFKDSIRAALTYPLFILIVSTLTICVLLMFVVPRLITMFEDMGQVLPLPTRILINSSSFLRTYVWIIIAVVFAFVFFLRRFYFSPQGKILFDRLKLKIIIAGPIVLKTEISRLMRTLSLLLSSGVPITSSLEISTSIVENQILKSEIQEFKEHISSGTSFSDSLKESEFFPEFVTNIVAIGEETGRLDQALLRIADDYEKELEKTLNVLTRMLEPIVILVMGLIVGFIVLSMLLPIFQINLIAK
jgi:type II secretory pathway component PulF